MALPKDKKNEIIQKIREGVSREVIIRDYDISPATYYRIRGEINEQSVKSEVDNEEEKKSHISEKPSPKQSLKSLTELNTSLDLELNNSRVSVKSQKPKIIIEEPRILKEKTVKFTEPKKIPEELTQKDESRRELVLKIRQYIHHFGDKLSSVYGNGREAFLKSLFYKTKAQLDIVHEEIVVTLTTSQSLPLMMKIFESFVEILEKTLSVFGIDVKGLHEDIKNDETFRDTITIVACEYSINMEPKKKLLFLLARSAFLRYQLNQSKKIELRTVPPQEVQVLKEKFANL